MRHLLAVIVALAAIAAAPAVTALHGAWWKGWGTATGPDGTVFPAEMLWGGALFVLDCHGGGCRSIGEGYLKITDPSELSSAKYTFSGMDDTRDVIYVDEPICPGGFVMEHIANYSVTFAGGRIAGPMRNCLSDGINHNEFAGDFLSFKLAIRSEGTFGVAHG